MEKADSASEVSKWATLDRNILAIIFDKLDIIDLTIGASRVCISWFLASHDKTLWNTIDLAKIQLKGQNVIFYRVEDEVEEALKLSNLVIKVSKFFFNFCEVEGIKLRNLLIEITKLSRAVPKNLFFNFYSNIQAKDLMFVAERMSNIEKLVLPVSWYHNNEKSFRFAFSQWKNLKTLVIARNDYFIWTFEFQVVGENCSNLTNLKILGPLDELDAAKIVRYLQSLKRLSLQCSFVRVAGVLSLIRGLRNLAILNLTHCKTLPYWNPNSIDDNNLVHAATQKLEKFIICSQNACKDCEDRPGLFGRHAFFEKNWRNDEIKELEF